MQRHFFHYQAVGHDVIRHGQGIGIPHIDFMLAGGYLMVGIFDADTHLFQGEDGIPPQIDGGVQRGQVEVAALVQGLGGVGPVVFLLK